MRMNFRDCGEMNGFFIASYPTELGQDSTPTFFEEYTTSAATKWEFKRLANYLTARRGVN
jgi:hypothetical protein